MRLGEALPLAVLCMMRHVTDAKLSETKLS